MRKLGFLLLLLGLGTPVVTSFLSRGSHPAGGLLWNMQHMTLPIALPERCCINEEERLAVRNRLNRQGREESLLAEFHLLLTSYPRITEVQFSDRAHLILAKFREQAASNSRYMRIANNTWAHELKQVLMSDPATCDRILAREGVHIKPGNIQEAEEIFSRIKDIRNLNRSSPAYIYLVGVGINALITSTMANSVRDQIQALRQERVCAPKEPPPEYGWLWVPKGEVAYRHIAAGGASLAILGTAFLFANRFSRKARPGPSSP